MCQIVDQWEHYKADLARFWFVELDAQKRQSAIGIVWNNLQAILKKLCILDEIVQELPLCRYLRKLKERLLANNGQCLWDACRNKNRYGNPLQARDQLSTLSVLF